MKNAISEEILDLLLNNILKKSKPQRPGLVLNWRVKYESKRFD